MAEDSPNFGIQSTDMGGFGDTNLLNDLVAPETSTANPDDITSVETTTEETSQAPIQTTAGETIPEEVAKNPTALTDFLLGDEEEEEEIQTTVETTTVQTTEAPATTTDETTEAPETTTTTEDEGSIQFDALATELATLGVFNLQEGEENFESIQDGETFLARFQQEKERGAQQILSEFLSQHGQEHYDAFDAIFVKGLNPKEYYTATAEIQKFADMDLTVERNQESVIRQTLLKQGFESDDVETEIERLKNYGDLEEVSKRHHKVLVKDEKDQLKAKTEQASQEAQRKTAIKQQYQQNVTNILNDKIKAKAFDGIPVTPKIAQELQDFLLVDKWKTETGETLTDFDRHILELKRPENHEQKVKLGLLLKLLESDPTLSTIQKTGASKQASQLFKDVARQKTKAKRTTDSKPKPAPSWFRK